MLSVVTEWERERGNYIKPPIGAVCYEGQLGPQTQGRMLPSPSIRLALFLSLSPGYYHYHRPSLFDRATAAAAPLRLHKQGCCCDTREDLWLVSDVACSVAPRLYQYQSAQHISLQGRGRQKQEKKVMMMCQKNTAAVFASSDSIGGSHPCYLWRIIWPGQNLSWLVFGLILSCL